MISVGRCLQQEKMRQLHTPLNQDMQQQTLCHKDRAWAGGGGGGGGGAGCAGAAGCIVIPASSMHSNKKEFSLEWGFQT